MVLVGSAKPAADHLGPVKLAARGRGIEYCRHRACPPTELTGAPSVSPLVTCAPLRPPPCGSPLQGRGPCAAISTSSSWPCHTCCSGDAKIRSESSRTERTRLGHQVIASADVAQGGPFAWLCRSALPEKYRPSVELGGGRTLIGPPQGDFPIAPRVSPKVGEGGGEL